MRTIHLLLTLFITCSSFSQWPTSTQTDSALWIGTGGFNASAVTFDDGSIIICSGPWSTINLLKLDPRGHRVWPDIVTAHYNDSTDAEGGADIVSDGAGGAIMLWGDHRGAYQDSVEGEYLNHALYIQRVDSNGRVQWTPGGVLVAPPHTGKKIHGLTTDGAGGTVVSWGENAYGYPDAPNIDNLKAARFNSDGQKLWEVLLDSISRPSGIIFQNITRAGKYVYIDYIKWPPVGGPETYITRIIDTAGVIPTDSIWYSFHSNKSWRDSILFSLSYPLGSNQFQKIGSMGEIYWSRAFSIPGNCQSPSPYLNTIAVPDGQGGIYYVRGCNDTVFHFDRNDGSISRLIFHGIDSIGGYIFSDGDGGIVLANTYGRTQRYDAFGTCLWHSNGDILCEPIIYLNDPENAYFERFFSDNNGGIIVLFWNGGIYATHTGRFGRVGIVPVQEEQADLPRSVELFHSYPNPFNVSTKITFTIPLCTHLNLSIYTVLGELLQTLLNEELNAGKYQVNFDARNYSSGMYFVVLRTELFPPQTTKLLLLR